MRFWTVLMALAASTLATTALAGTQLERLERTDLAKATFSGTQLEAQGVRVTLKAGLSTGTFETAPINAPAFDTAVVSWNAITPRGSSLKLEVRARIGSRWTRYYPLALWSTQSQQSRRSFANTADADGRINTDTLELKRRASALQVRITLSGKTSPTLTGLASVTSDSSQHDRPVPQASDQAAWGLELPVPTRSQMIYPDGGEVWCSPTSVTMILEYWSAKLGRDLADTVPTAAKATWDSVYGGSGNWPFNTAYASSKGLSAYINRLSSLSQAEVYIQRGLPLAMSIGWGRGELPGAHLGYSQGHIVVLRGFTKTGDPIINDPAAKTDAGVRTIYPRDAFERAWIEHSGGIIYVIEGG